MTPLRLMNYVKVMIFIFLTITMKFSFSTLQSKPSWSQPYMQKNRICGDLNDLERNKCLQESVFARNRLECVSHCSQDSYCIGSYLQTGITSDNSNVCHLIKLCQHVVDNLGCAAGGNHVDVFMKKCQNGGKFVVKNAVRVCRCYAPWAGEYCERYPNNCREIVISGWRFGINYKVNLLVDGLVTKAECLNFGTSSKMTIMRSNGESNSSRSWQEYRNGFYINDNHYWLGLQNMYDLFPLFGGNNNLKIWIRFEKSDGKGASFYITYKQFRINNESLGYSYSYEKADYSNAISSVPTIESYKCMADNMGAPFSTWDRDNDFDPDNNCAQLSSSGWWFKTCPHPVACNPLGMKPNSTPSYVIQHSDLALFGIDIINSQIGLGFQSISMAFYKAHSKNDY